MNPSTLAQTAALWVRHRQLEAYYLSALGFIASVRGETSGLKSIRPVIDRLSPSGEWGSKVGSGVTPEAWLASAKEAWLGITAQVENAKGDNLYTRAWEQIVVGSVTDTVTAVRTTAAAVEAGWKPAAVLVVVALVALAVIKVTR